MKKENKHMVDLFGRALLVQFRVEQALRGRHGCVCNECEEDMIKAFKRLMGDMIE